VSHDTNRPEQVLMLSSIATWCRMFCKPLYDSFTWYSLLLWRYERWASGVWYSRTDTFLHGHWIYVKEEVHPERMQRQ
jgi:hypothetical protein